MSKTDIRWEQRFSNFNKALNKLNLAVEYMKEILNDDEDNHDFDEIVGEGLIQRFEYTHELAWNVMKDFLEFQGIQNITGSRDATRDAFEKELIADGHVWMNMIKSRNLTTHTYNEEVANEIIDAILKEYHPRFQEFQKTMEERRSGGQGKMFDK